MDCPRQFMPQIDFLKKFFAENGILLLGILMGRMKSLIALMLCILCASACEQQSGTAPFSHNSGSSTTPATRLLILSSGNGQSGTVGTTLTSTFSALVEDLNSNPLPNIAISWLVTAGGGSLQTCASTTNNSGLAQCSLTLGTAAGSNTVSASVSGAASAILFSATGIAGAYSLSHSTLAESASSVVTGGVSTLTLTLKDSYGNLVSDGSQAIAFSIIGSGTSVGTLSGSSYSGSGKYTATFTGSACGTADTIQASIGGAAVSSTVSIQVSPVISIPSFSVNGGGTAEFTVNLSTPSVAAITFNYITGDGTAVQGAQYTATSGTGSIAAGQTSTTIDVPTLNDGSVNETKSFTLNLSAITNASSTTASGTANIVTAAQDWLFASGSTPSGLSVARAGTATYVNASGVITEASANTARLDYDPNSHAALGLLIEPTATNSFLNSQALTDPSFTVYDLTTTPVSSATTLAPDGTSSAVLFTEDTSNSAHHITVPAISWTSGAPFTFSVFLKLPAANPATGASLTVSDVLGGTVFGVCILTNPYPDYAYSFDDGVNGATTSGYSMSSYGNGWFRCSVSGSTNGTALTAQIGLVNSSQAFNFTGDGVSGMYVWGAQFEAGNQVTSYIPTTASAVSRNADIASLGFSSSWYRQSEGTWIFKGTPNAVPASGDTELFSAIGPSASTNFYGMSIASSSGNPISYQVTEGGTVQANGTSAGGSAAAGTALTAGFAYSAASTNACTDDTLGTVSSGITLPTISGIHLGQDQVGESIFNGHVSELIYYPARIEDSAFQTLTH
jgi:hypothetical protein